MKLSELEPGNRAVVTELRCGEGLNRRLTDLGMTPGLEIACLHRAPGGTPAAYEIRGAAIALRLSDAQNIYVEALP